MAPRLTTAGRCKLKFRKNLWRPLRLTSSKLTMLFGHGMDERSMLVFADRGRSSSSESEQILKGMLIN